MEKEILQKAGLNNAQAEVYYTLLNNGEMSPAEIAKHTDESRENCYALLKKLEGLNLVEKTNAKKTAYRVLNPSNLEILAEKRRRVVAKNEKIVKDNMTMLLDLFYANNEMPGSRTLEGIDGIKEVYKDILRVGKDVYFMRTQFDDQIRIDDFLHKYKVQRAQAGIKTYALVPEVPPKEKKDLFAKDSQYNVERVTRPTEDYTAAMEMHVYGDKIALVSFGETEMATIITSPTIAEAMRQILKIMMNFYKENSLQE